MADQVTSQGASSSATSASTQPAVLPQQSDEAQESSATTTSPLEEDDVVEADDDFDADSALGADDNSESTSIASSIYAGHVENGRRYQTKREGEYWGPSDEKQWESMHAAHVLCMILDYQQKNNLFRSPVPETAQNILDVGTGGGVWAIEVADRYPSAVVQGIDLFPPPQTWVPPNCKLEVDDLLKTWQFKQRFDLIHLRLMLGAFTDSQWKGIYKQAYENLLPGGWIEQLEPNTKVWCDDGTLPADAAFAKWGDILNPAFEASGKPIDTEEKMRARIEAAGFINVNEKVYKAPIGEWAKNPVMKEAGKFNKMQALMGMEGMCLYALTKFGTPNPWSVEEVQAYLEKVRKEVNNPRIHTYTRYRRVWAQKPLEA